MHTEYNTFKLLKYYILDNIFFFKKNYRDNNILVQPEPTMVNPWFESWDHNNHMEPKSNQNRELISYQPNIEGQKYIKNNN
jgi:hypothetical protein